MSKLNAFLRPVSTERTKEIVVSDRFLELDEQGNPIEGKAAKITIKAISQEENQALIKASTREAEDSKGQPYNKFDNAEYQKRLIVACTVSPDFGNTEMCSAYGTLDPTEVPGKMFFSGEYAKLVNEIMEINGYKDIIKLSDDAKNS